MSVSSRQVVLLNQMIRHVVLPLLLALALARLLPTEEFSGVLTVRQDSSALNGKTYKVRAPIYSSQLKNIQHQVVKIVLADPSHACSSIIQSKSAADHEAIFYLVVGDEGSCSYSRKAEVVKQALGRGIIIIDSPKGINNLNYRNSDSDRFITLLISEDDGKVLAKSKSLLAELTMSKAAAEEDKGLVQIWVSSLNKDSYETLRWWKESSAEIAGIEKVVNWKPRFAYYSCSDQKTCSGEFVSSCACGGEFCSPESHEKSSNVLVREDIRQHLIFEDHPTKFLNYITTFEQQCLANYISTKYVEDCSTSIMQNLDLPEDDINNKIDFFLSSCDARDGESIYQLYQDLSIDRNKYKQIGHYPTVILNHQQLDFKNKNEFKSLLCRKLSLQQANGCVTITESTTILQKIVTWVFYFILINLLLGVGAFVVVFFRKKLRRDMNKQLKMQVSTAVEHYFSLSEMK